MLKGQYQHNLDDKGRVFIPSKLRLSLGEQFVLTRGLEGCLFIYPQNEWQKFEEKLSSLSIASKNARLFTRHFTSSAVDCSVDKQGRISIPQNLREFAGIDRDVVVNGVIDRVEIWDRERWNEYMSQADDNYLAEQIESLDI